MSSEDSQCEQNTEARDVALVASSTPDPQPEYLGERDGQGTSTTIWLAVLIILLVAVSVGYWFLLNHWRSQGK